MENITYAIFDDFKWRLLGLKHCIKDTCEHKFLFMLHEKDKLMDELSRKKNEVDCLLVCYPFNQPESYEVIREACNKFKLKIIVVLFAHEIEERRIDLIEHGASGIHSMADELSELFAYMDKINHHDYIFNKYFTTEMIGKLRERRLFKNMNKTKIFSEKDIRIIIMLFFGKSREEIAAAVDMTLGKLKNRINYLEKVVSDYSKGKQANLFRFALDHDYIPGYGRTDSYFKITDSKKISEKMLRGVSG